MSDAERSARYVLGGNLSTIRARVGMASAQELADKVKEIGGRLDRAAIAKIESGARNVSLDEALLLAVALDVSPVHLFIPLDDKELVQVAPKLDAVSARDAREWIRGRSALPSTNEKTFRTAWIPETEWEQQNARVEQAYQEWVRADRELRVAKVMLRTISDDFGRAEAPDPMDSLPSAFGRPPSKAAQTTQLLERKLSAAYERVAEATVDADDARARYRKIQAESGRED